MTPNFVITCPRVVRHFHWRFWKPVECVGGKVYFGFYYDCTIRNDDGRPHRSLQTRQQYLAKRALRLVP